jgi:PPOX class probable F420-dependent enzyme
VSVLPPSAIELIEADALAHLVTINRDGSPQVTCVWVGMDGDEIVSAHLFPQRKLQNVERDPRVVLSLEASGANAVGMRHYLVVHGRARIEPGGAPEWLQHLAHTYVGPDTRFPPMPDPPPGVRLRITPERVGGLGPWTERG